MHIVQVTSAHPRTDTRVMHKQCRSLAAAGYRVSLVVADGKGNQSRGGVEIRDVGLARGRVARMGLSAYRVFREARRLDADLYHLHDPELIPWGLLLRQKGVPVVFDAHEDLPAQIETKFYIPAPLRVPLARAVAAGERMALPHFDSLVTATPKIAEKLSHVNPRTTLVANYPLCEEFAPVGEGIPEHALFVGAISRIRGIEVLVDAAAMLKSGRRLRLAGPMAPDGVEMAIANSPGISRTDVLGPLSRAEVADEMRHARCGIVTFLDAPNHVCAQPNKLFEYMSAGIPVVASHFPLWRELIEGHNCGICVDPSDAAAIAEAIDYLFDHPEEAKAMGERGRQAIERSLNWERQHQALRELYEKLGVTP